MDSYVNPRPLNILMIGNSFSWDAADCGYGLTQSQTYATMKSMLAEEYDVHMGVMYRGSATLAYHATCAMNNSGGYTYTEIGPETGYTWNPSSGGAEPNYILDHLNERDWDIIVIQAYQHEADGTEPRSTYTGGDARFVEPDASVSYLLDYFAEHEPNAAVYYYMPWATVKFYGSDGTEAGYQAITEYTETHVPYMTGANSGKQFAGIIPVGTGIENARTTYLNRLQFASNGSTPPQKDVQIGLLADTQHVSLGLGRYIAGAVVAETLIPQEMRKDSYAWPSVKDSPAVGVLPQEYSAIAQLAAKNAVSQPYQVTTLSGYEADLADRVCDAIETGDYAASGIADETALLEHVKKIVDRYLENAGNAETELTIHSFTLENGQVKDLNATVAIRVGYTKRMARINAVEGQSHSFGDWVHVSVPSASAAGIDSRVCTVCGYIQTVEVEGSWRKYDLAAHLQQLPENSCCGTNLWELLEPEKLMIDHLGKWVSAGATVYSVTIPVSPGDKIYANSFDQTGTKKGIQVSFIGDYGIVKTTFSSGTYEEFHANGGYLIAPEGAIAVNIPVWNIDDEDNIVQILNYDHVYDVSVVAPTCTERGYTTYTCACGDSYIDTYVKAKGHTEAEIPAKEPTCTAAGATVGVKCSTCNEILTTPEAIKAKGHSYDDVVTSPTCTAQGYTTHTCACGDSYVDSYVDAHGHRYAAWYITTAPKCEAVGEERRDCGSCDHYEARMVDALGHDLMQQEAKAPACTAIGWNAYETCSRCDYSTYTELPVTGHRYKSVVTMPTCTTQGYSTYACRCGDSYVADYMDAKGHSWNAANCTAPKTCTTCGNTEGTANGHTWRQASCTSPRTCTSCKLTEGSALGHNWKDATCDNPKICTRCKASSGRPAGHTYDDGVDGTCNGCGIHREETENRTVMHMFRMYDPNSGEHFYTGSTVERDNLVAAGWNYEGVGFTFSMTTGVPVHRLYDPVTGEHLYTMDEEEKSTLMAAGWNYESVAFNSAYDTEVPQYRIHNPNATRGAYHFTASIEERDFLLSVGWEDQGIGFYSSWK